jgi:hydroxymethylbilane synthase
LADDAQVAGILARVNDAPTYCIAVAEMAFLKALNAGCQFPVASFAEFVQGSGAENGGAAPVMKIRGIYWDEASKRLLRAEYCGPVKTVEAAREAGIALAGKIREQL